MRNVCVMLKTLLKEFMVDFRYSLFVKLFVVKKLQPFQYKISIKSSLYDSRVAC